jgi:hypothetical protein
MGMEPMLRISLYSYLYLKLLLLMSSFNKNGEESRQGSAGRKVGGCGGEGEGEGWGERWPKQYMHI